MQPLKSSSLYTFSKITFYLNIQFIKVKFLLIRLNTITNFSDKNSKNVVIVYPLRTPTRCSLHLLKLFFRKAQMSWLEMINCCENWAIHANFLAKCVVQGKMSSWVIWIRKLVFQQHWVVVYVKLALKIAFTSDSALNNMKPPPVCSWMPVAANVI